MLGQRGTRCPGIKLTLNQWLVFAGIVIRTEDRPAGIIAATRCRIHALQNLPWSHCNHLCISHTGRATWTTRILTTGIYAYSSLGRRDELEPLGDGLMWWLVLRSAHLAIVRISSETANSNWAVKRIGESASWADLTILLVYSENSMSAITQPLGCQPHTQSIVSHSQTACDCINPMLGQWLTFPAFLPLVFHAQSWLWHIIYFFVEVFRVILTPQKHIKNPARLAKLRSVSLNICSQIYISPKLSQWCILVDCLSSTDHMIRLDLWSSRLCSCVWNDVKIDKK